MAPHRWQCVALVALLATATATTSVRVAVPDIAGTLYPQPAQGRVARQFATPSASLTPFYATTITGNDALSPCNVTAALCLALVWTSEYQHDPFVLTALEAPAVVRSRTFDGLANLSATLLPVLEGSEGGDATSQSQTRTLWQLDVPHATPVGSTTPTIDVLFRLRQQSQLRGARDQLLVHVVATREQSGANIATVETYVVYGNQRVRHTVTHVSESQVRMDLTISRNASHTDVLLPDSNPLVPVVRPEANATTDGWHFVDSECRRCTALLLECDSPRDLDSGACTYETSLAEVPTCLRTTKGFSTDWFKTLLAEYTLGATTSLTTPVWECLRDIFARESTDFQVPGRQSLSWNATNALSCLAARQCPFGPLNGVLPNTTYPTTMLQLSKPTPFIYRLEWPVYQPLGGTFDVAFGGGSQFDPTFAAYAEEISDVSVTGDVERVLQEIFSGLDYVRVKATLNQDSSSKMLDVEVWNLPHWYFYINFVANSEDVSFSITPTNPDGTTLLRIAAFNRTQIAFENECDQCSSELNACREDDTCRLAVLPCVTRELTAIDTHTAVVDADHGTFLINVLPVLASTCFRDLPVASWNPIRRAVVCWSRYKCQLNEANTSTTEEPTLFRLVNGSQVLSVPFNLTQDGTKVVRLAISLDGATYPFHSSVEKLGMFVRLFVVRNAADVFVDIEESTLNTSLIQLRLTYANTILPSNPVFNNSTDVLVIEDSSPKGFVEFVAIDSFSVQGARAVLSSFLNSVISDGDVVAETNSPWALAPQCVQCSANLYGCTPTEVEQNTCVYSNAPSQLAQCIRQAFPRIDMASLLASHDSTSNPRVVTTDITRCVQTVTALTGATLSSRQLSTKALSCFSDTSCPFGPLDLVQPGRMLQLTVSNAVHSLRIPADKFRLELTLFMGKYTIGQAEITETDYIPNVLYGILEPLGITVQAQSHYADTEWTLAITYSSVVTSDFYVQIAATSEPSPPNISQAFLRSVTQLQVGPRNVTSVYLASEVDNKPTVNTPTPAPSYNASSPFLSFSNECNQCDSIHLAACGRSQYCRATVAQCFQSTLSMYSFGNLAQQMPDGSTSVDLAPILRSCVTSGSFFDWWEPIQKWLGCYAAARCPITRPDPGRSEDAYLEFVPASVNFSTDNLDIWDNWYNDLPVYLSTSGSSLSLRTNIRVDSNEKLQEACELATQGISNVTITISPLANPQGTFVTIVYNDSFFGQPLTPVGATSVVQTQAKLLVRSTTNGFPSFSWAWLADKLYTMSNTSPDTPRSCSACASTYLSLCQSMPNCKWTMLQCVSNRLDTAYARLSNWNSDRDAYQLLMECSQALSAADWWPVQKYLICMSDLQCPVNGIRSSTSFIRLQSGRVRLFVNSVTEPTQYQIYVSFEGTAHYPMTVLELHNLLEGMIGYPGPGHVEMTVTAMPNSGMSQVDFYFRDYVGKLPWLAYAGGPVEVRSPSVLFYSMGNVDTSLLTDQLAFAFSPLLSFSNECNQCDSIHLAACGRSQYCRATVAQCFQSTLSMYSFGNLAQQMPDGSTSVDLAPILRSCVTSGSFFDWWEPIQKWLGCYAAARCPITRPDPGRSEDAYLEFVPASVEFNSTFTNLWSDSSNEVMIQLPAEGSSLSGRSIRVYSNQTLHKAFEQATQGIVSDITVTTSPLADAQGTAVRIVYEDTFLGAPVMPTVDYVAVTSAISSQATLRVRSTSVSVPPSAWDFLTDKLLSMVYASSTTAQSCVGCATQYIQTCIVLPNCKGYLLECLANSIGNDYTFLSDSNPDQSVYEVLMGCTRDVPVTEWWPVQKYFTCLRDLQCDVGMPYSASYVRLRSGHIRIMVNSTTSQYMMAVSFERRSWYPTTVPELYYVLQTAIGSTGIVDMRVTSNPSSGKNQVDFFFQDYIGKLPRVYYSGLSAEDWPPDIVIYSRGTAMTSQLSADLGIYNTVPKCSETCSQYLEDCVRGDSYSSLQCRYHVLQCVTNIFRNQGSSTDLSASVRDCIYPTYKSIQPITQYFGCLSRKACALNQARSSFPRTRLMLHPGEQNVSFIGSRMVTMTSPLGFGDSNTQSFSADNLEYFRQRVRASILESSADVNVSIGTLPGGSQGLIITYDNYLGSLPVVSGPDISDVTEKLPSISFTSDVPGNSRWDRLTESLASFDVDKSSGCLSCVLDNLMNCPVCMSTVVPSLLMMLQDITAYSSFNLTDTFYTCVDTLPPSEWVPVAQMLNCFMIKGCPVSDDSGSVRPPNAPTTFLEVSPAKITLWTPDVNYQAGRFSYGRAPNHSISGVPDYRGPVTIDVDRTNQFVDFIQSYRSLLDTAGQSPTITVTERAQDPTEPLIAIDVEVRYFFGWLPRFESWMYGPTDAPAESELPTFIAQTYGNVSGASLAGLVSWMQLVVTPSPPPKVPTGICATQCAQAFFGCDLDAIASSQCNYNTTTAFFAACLRRHVPPSVFYGISRADDSTYIISTALSECFALAQEQDALVGAASFRDDLWNRANDHLTCYELYGCAFGPLYESLAFGRMVLLQSTSSGRAFVVSSVSFTARFRATFGFRVVESVQFTESISDEDLTALVVDILPKGVVAATKSWTGQYEYTIYVNYSSIFLPDFGLSLDAGPVTVRDISGNATTLAVLRTVALDSMYLDDAGPT